MDLSTGKNATVRGAGVTETNSRNYLHTYLLHISSRRLSYSRWTHRQDDLRGPRRPPGKRELTYNLRSLVKTDNSHNEHDKYQHHQRERSPSHRSVGNILKGLNAGDWKSSVDRPYRLPHFVEKGLCRSTRVANHECRRSNGPWRSRCIGARVECGPIHGRRRRLLNSGTPDIFHHSDDFIPGREVPGANAFPRRTRGRAPQFTSQLL
jgi:hypothetical protein